MSTTPTRWSDVQDLVYEIVNRGRRHEPDDQRTSESTRDPEPSRSNAN